MKTVFQKISTGEIALFVIGFVFVIFFSSYKLFISPEPWLDEGLIIQAAQGILETGRASLPVAPEVFEPMGYITTGFPVTLPLAVVFGVFGLSLEAARLVMLLFLIIFYFVLWFYSRQAIGGVAGWLGFFLLIFFAPIYGNGRNVLGEIPGLLMMFLSLLPLLSPGILTRKRALLSGVGAGLAVATKPIFLLFLPALLLALVIRHHDLKLKKVFIFGAFGVIAPILLWAFLQFHEMTLASLLAVYANPQDIGIQSAIAINLKRFFTESQPLYFLVSLVIWFASYGVRRFRRESIPIAEEALLFFAILVFIAFLRTQGYYRYFFPAQVLSILYLPYSLWYLIGRRSQLFSRLVIVGLCLLILFQAYETSFHSWVAVHFNSTRTVSLENYFANLNAKEEIFIYQAPEVAVFAAKHPFYQFTQITPSLSFGNSYVSLVKSGSVSQVITPADFYESHKSDLFSRYTISSQLDSYVVLLHK
jgi:hypothetical protein